MIKTILNIVVGIVDKVPFLRGYRTALLVTSLGVMAVLDAFKVGPGNLYDSLSPYVWPAAVATGLAHK